MWKIASTMCLESLLMDSFHVWPQEVSVPQSLDWTHTPTVASAHFKQGRKTFQIVFSAFVRIKSGLRIHLCVAQYSCLATGSSKLLQLCFYPVQSFASSYTLKLYLQFVRQSLISQLWHYYTVLWDICLEGIWVFWTLFSVLGAFRSEPCVHSQYEVTPHCENTPVQVKVLQKRMWVSLFPENEKSAFVHSNIPCQCFMIIYIGCFWTLMLH